MTCFFSIGSAPARRYASIGSSLSGFASIRKRPRDDGVKPNSTRNDFIKNNRGINDDADLPEEFLSSIYDDIVNNEIRMKDELDAALGQATASGPGIAGALVSVGRDLQREAYMLQSSGMANKTEVSRATFRPPRLLTHIDRLFSRH